MASQVLAGLPEMAKLLPVAHTSGLENKTFEGSQTWPVIH